MIILIPFDFKMKLVSPIKIFISLHTFLVSLNMSLLKNTPITQQ